MNSLPPLVRHPLILPMSNPVPSLPFVMAQQLRILAERASELKVESQNKLGKSMVLLVGSVFGGLVLGDELFCLFGFLKS